MPGTVLRTLLTHLILTAALGSIGTDVASEHSDAELFAQDPHGKWPKQDLNQDLFGSRAHAPTLYIMSLVFADFAFSLIEVPAFLSLSHPAWSWTAS